MALNHGNAHSLLGILSHYALYAKPILRANRTALPRNAPGARSITVWYSFTRQVFRSFLCNQLHVRAANNDIRSTI
jgi:hypothetical protein